MSNNPSYLASSAPSCVPTLHHEPNYPHDHILVSMTCSCGWKSPQWAALNDQVSIELADASVWGAMWKHGAEVQQDYAAKLRTALWNHADTMEVASALIEEAQGRPVWKRGRNAVIDMRRLANGDTDVAG